MTLKIISTTEILFEGEAGMVSLPGTLGRFTVLNNHASLVSTLEAGSIDYREEGASGDGASGHFEIKGGIADIDRNVVSVCVY